jgi:hypothetical protein
MRHLVPKRFFVQTIGRFASEFGDLRHWQLDLGAGDSTLPVDVPPAVRA